jgi:hypothetical protein
MRCLTVIITTKIILYEFQSSLNSRGEKKKTMYTQNTHIYLRIRKRKTSIQKENSMYDNLKIKMDIMLLVDLLFLFVVFFQLIIIC